MFFFILKKTVSEEMKRRPNVALMLAQRRWPIIETTYVYYI